MVHLYGLSHSIMECVRRWIVEYEINHLLKLVYTFWEEETEFASLFKFFEVLTVCVSVYDVALCTTSTENDY